MQNHSESQSFHWFDDLPAAPASVPITRPSGSGTFEIGAIPSHATVVVPTPPACERRVPIWVLVLSAIAGASAFVLGAAVMSLF